MPKFSERFRQLRNEHGLSQQALADQLGFSKSSVNMYERGEREPGIDSMEAIADYFNVDLDYLMGRTDIPNRIEWLTSVDREAAASLLSNAAKSPAQQAAETNLGGKIKTYRKAAGLTQVELARLAHISRSYLNDVEANRYHPSVATLNDICAALQIKTSTLFDDDDEKAPSVRPDAGDPLDRQILDLFDKLPDGDKESVLSLLRSLTKDR